MKDFDFTYADEKIGHKEIFLLVPSMIIGVGIITLPRSLAEIIGFSDGWISIVIAGFITSMFAWIVVKLASQFPNQTFFEYSSKIIPKPIAAILTVVFGLHFASFTSYEARSIATISKQYIFDRTPVEFITLVFVLLVA